jgi:phosphoribosylamine-glycine ligase
VAKTTKEEDGITKAIRDGDETDLEEAMAKAALEREAALAREEARTATEAAVLEKTVREESEFIAQHTAVVKAYPGKADDSARLLFRIKKAVKADDYTALEVLIKAGNAALTQSGRAIGLTAPEASASTAAEELRTLATEISKAQHIPFADAYEKACYERQDLVADVRKRRSRDDD